MPNQKTRWLDPQPVVLPSGFQDAVGGSPIVANRLFQSGYTQIEQALAFLDPDRYQPAPATDLPDLDRAAKRLQQAITSGERIFVWGDFDVDGQTATTLLVEMLRGLGAQVLYHIPVRTSESHGITLSVLEKYITAGMDLLLTCDTGITAFAAVDFAQRKGVPVIVTDHHQLGERLPDALAVVNPQRLPVSHPMAGLPGVGVAYQLARRLYALAGRPEDIESQLDLVALGIVADVARQTADTRYLLQRGLEVLRQARRLGLQSLYARAELNPAHLTEEHIGFIIAPRLNALGRLSDANRSVEFLTTADLSLARQEANFLEQLNTRRKLETSQVYQGALSILDQNPELLDFACLVLNNPSWPAGVIGIVASRLVDRFGKPVILLSTPPDQPVRGSARSISGVNITAAIAAQQDLLASYGGHPMAAGLSLELDPETGSLQDQIADFRKRLSQSIIEMTGGVLPQRSIAIDAYLPLADLTPELVAGLSCLAPFGMGNPAPVLVSQDLILVNHSVLGRDQEHRLLTVRSKDGAVQRVVWWNGADEPLPDGRFDLAYTASTSNFRGQEQIQIELLDVRTQPVSAPELTTTRSVTLFDRRRDADRLSILAEFQERTGQPVMVWAEGLSLPDLHSATRLDLELSSDLAVVSIPPGPDVLESAMQLVRPERVILFGVDPGLDEIQPFIVRLLGLLKHAINRRAGLVSLEQLAAAMAHRPEVVQAGLEFTRSLGQIEFEILPDNMIRCNPGTGSSSEDRVQSQQILQAFLDETRAYRAYYLRANARSLVTHNSFLNTDPTA